MKSLRRVIQIMGKNRVDCPHLSEVVMQLAYEDWYGRTAALLVGSDLPPSFVEDVLTNREAMIQLYEQGYASAEVLIHLRKQYRLEKEAEAERKRRAAATESWRQASDVLAVGWYYFTDAVFSTRIGPMSREELREKARCGEITRRTFVAHDRLGGQILAESVDWLFD